MPDLHVKVALLVGGRKESDMGALLRFGSCHGEHVLYLVSAHLSDELDTCM